MTFVNALIRLCLNSVKCVKGAYKRRLFHLVSRISISLYYIIGIYTVRHLDGGTYRQNDVAISNGYLVTGLFYIVNSVIYLSIPFAFLTIFGIAWYNPVPKEKRGHLSTTDVPFVLFRVVTRGLYPKLVEKVTKQNLDMCQKVGLWNFKFEIVTDRALLLPKSHSVREIIVPDSYKTENGTLFKARALHYCLDQSVNILSADDWIVHLDEETLLTERVLFGIVDFITRSKADIGQGVITYGECEVENWLTTLLDGIRTAVDYGLFRVGLQMFKCPLFGFKGSFIVVRMDVEDKVGFDFGPKESIAEDLRFALSAWSHGFKFDFIEGEMRERSTFTISDFVKQRKRWFIGHFNILWGDSVPIKYKLGILPMHISNILLWANLLKTVSPLFINVPLPVWYQYLVAVTTVSILFLFTFGNFMSLSKVRFSWRRRLILSLLSQILLPLSGVLEAFAVLQGLLDRSRVAFDIVEKELAYKGKVPPVISV